MKFYNKSIFTLVFLFTGLLILTSCEKSKIAGNLLDKSNRSQIDDEVQWSSESTADLFLNDLYGRVPEFYNSPSQLDDFTDDQANHFYYASYNWKNGVVSPSTSNYSVWGTISGTGSIINWPQMYQNIRRCNQFIIKVNENKSNFSEAWVNKRLDEARFLRAFFYSWLLNFYGGVPIITDVLDRNTMDESELDKPRNTFEETVNFITSELNQVVEDNYLEVKYNNGDANSGRATLGAALMLKGWIELYAASPAFNTSTPVAGKNDGSVNAYDGYLQARWETAAQTFKKFIDEYGNHAPYGLFSDLSQQGLWNEDHEYNEEVIFDRQYVAGNTNLGSTFEQHGGIVYVLGAYLNWGNYEPTQELVDAFFMKNGKSITDPASGYDPQKPYTNRDPRFYNWISYDGARYFVDWMDRPDTIYTRIDKVKPSLNEINFGTGDVSNTGYYFIKKINPKLRPGSGTGGANYIYFRYAEVLLGYAEAQNEASGPDGTVYDAINKIRERAGLPDLEPGLNQTQMREAIRHERRVELSWENKRYFDLIRWGIAKDKLSVDRHGMKITNTSPGNNAGVWQYEPIPLEQPHVFDNRMWFAPVPQDAIDRNPKLIQNPNY